MFLFFVVVKKRVCPRGAKAHYFYPLIYFVFHLKNFGDILMFVEYWFLIVGQIGTKDLWVNPLPIFKHNYVNFFENDLCIKNMLR